MPTPEFIVRLRERIGHDPLWLVGVTGYIEDESGRILLGKRTDTGRWALISGINEPGEEPADTLVREAAEEAGVRIAVRELVSVHADPREVTYENGDRVQYLELLFTCRLLDEPCAACVSDEESSDVGWFDLAQLPEPLSESSRERIELAARYRARAGCGDARTLFRSADSWLPYGRTGSTAGDVVLRERDAR
ncbi:NUDIX hydrolase [Collinsella tanakaei]|uniref:NUDIX hydrolase n=1 Tax=Collinsella tanakaei TaxID=626935 RepID=UPI0025A45A8A|nr:NUDIX domain-containing protein [Collinsella tanakaei]MDM8300608.1 NUDIX domain-containing protein [Collinsella tanakaei]